MSEGTRGRASAGRGGGGGAVSLGGRRGRPTAAADQLRFLRFQTAAATAAAYMYSIANTGAAK